jgi:hypothetical protein
MENLIYFLLEEKLIKNTSKENPKSIVSWEELYESYELIATIQIKEEEVITAIEELSEYLKGTIKFKNKYYKSSYGKMGLETSSHYYGIINKERYEKRDKRDNCQAKVYRHNLKEEIKFKKNSSNNSVNFYNLIESKIGTEELRNLYLKILLKELDNSKTNRQAKIISAIKVILSYQVKENLNKEEELYYYTLATSKEIDKDFFINYRNIKVKVEEYKDNLEVVNITFKIDNTKVYYFVSVLGLEKLESLINKIIKSI